MKDFNKCANTCEGPFGGCIGLIELGCPRHRIGRSGLATHKKDVWRRDAAKVALICGVHELRKLLLLWVILLLIYSESLSQCSIERKSKEFGWLVHGCVKSIYRSK